MLILTRKVGQTIVIGDTILVSVLGVQGNQVRIGIDAPVHIPVHREEVHLRIQETALAATSTEPADRENLNRRD